MYIRFFVKYKKKSCRSEATAQAWHVARAELPHALLNGSCLGPAHQTRPIWPAVIPPHNNYGHRLSCHHLVRHPASFLSPHACASAPPHSRWGCGSMCLLPVFVDTSPDSDPHSGYCTSTRTFHSMRAPSFLPSSDVPFVFHGFTLFFLPNLLPPPTIAAASRPTLVDAGTGWVDFAPSLFSCVPLRRIRWRLPRLGYLGDEEFRS
jgi:hypothetical protein